jgi:hypothetical protein
VAFGDHRNNGGSGLGAWLTRMDKSMQEFSSIAWLQYRIDGNKSGGLKEASIGHSS